MNLGGKYIKCILKYYLQENFVVVKCISFINKHQLNSISVIIQYVRHLSFFTYVMHHGYCIISVIV